MRDTGFLDRLFEKVLQEISGIDLVVPRRKNMKDQLDGCVAYLYSLHLCIVFIANEWRRLSVS
jgi:hypothetical protein